jgi:hypothetical protein
VLYHDRGCYNPRVRRASDRIAVVIALVISAVAIGATIRWNTFVPWGTDSSAYIDAAAQWAGRDLFHPTHFRFWAPWAHDAELETPLGRTPGATPGTIVTVYPPGYPLLLAAAQTIGGPLATHLVSPFFLGVLAFCAYLLAARISTPWAGVGASAMIASTPVGVAHVLMPMSDVPATALVAIAWLLALRPGMGAAMSAGAAMAMAILVRPNLAPLAMVIAFVLIASRWRLGDRTWARVLAFGSFCALGPAMLLWTQDALYGSPFQSGYRAANTFFRLERIPINAVHYPAMLIDLHGWLALAGLALVPFAFVLRPHDGGTERPWVVVAGAAGILLANYGVLLPYLTYEGWYWLRFLLPGMLALFVLLAAGLDRLRLIIASRSRLLQVVAVIPIVLVVREARTELFATFANLQGFPRVSMMGQYLREALPANAAILTYLQSGAAAYDTGRPIVRLDFVGPEMLDRVIDDLRRGGYHPVFVIDEGMEAPSFRDRYVDSPYRHLDWPARAEFWSVSPMLYLDPADRVAHYSGETYPTDILKTPVDYPYPKSGPARSRPQGPPMPKPHEARAFRATLDAFYRDRLGRPAADSFEPAGGAGRYTIRYLRYRLYGCDHDRATANVFAQLDGRTVPDVCGRLRSIVMPPRNEVVDFRHKLEAQFRNDRRTRPTPTHVDLDGDAIWTQEYLAHRLSGCSTTEATERVLDQIAGKAVAPGC